MLVTSHNIEYEEQELAKQAGNGDEGAFRLLFERYSQRIFRFCLLMLGDKDAAEDIYQDAFIALLRACREGKPMYSVGGYLIATARSRCLNYLKVSERTTPLSSRPELSYEQDLISHDIHQHVRKALLKLPEHYREALVLCEFDGYSYEEIAQILETSRHIVKNRIYRGKQMLRSLLEPIIDDDDSESTV